MFNNCNKGALESISNVINHGIRNQECGFNDALLFLAQMTDKDKLTNTLQECTKVIKLWHKHCYTNIIQTLCEIQCMFCLFLCPFSFVWIKN